MSLLQRTPKSCDIVCPYFQNEGAGNNSYEPRFEMKCLIEKGTLHSFLEILV